MWDGYYRNRYVSFLSRCNTNWQRGTINRRQLHVACASYWMLIHWQCTTIRCVCVVCHVHQDTVAWSAEWQRTCDNIRDEHMQPLSRPTLTSIMATWEVRHVDRVAGGRSGPVFWVLSCDDERHAPCSWRCSGYSRYSSSPLSVCGQSCSAWSVQCRARRRRNIDERRDSQLCAGLRAC